MRRVTCGVSSLWFRTNSPSASHPAATMLLTINSFRPLQCAVLRKKFEADQINRAARRSDPMNHPDKGFGELSQRAIAGKAPRHRWHLRQSWRLRICNLQSLNGPCGFESHSLHQLPHSRSVARGSGGLIGHRATRGLRRSLRLGSNPTLRHNKINRASGIAPRADHTFSRHPIQASRSQTAFAAVHDVGLRIGGAIASKRFGQRPCFKSSA